MKLSRQFTVFGSAIFCVVIFSLYLMLDRGHLDYPKSPRREGSFPQVRTEKVGTRGSERVGVGARSYPLLRDLSLSPMLSAPSGRGQTGGGLDPPPAWAPQPPHPGRAELTKYQAACGGRITLRGSRLVPALAPGPVGVVTCWPVNRRGVRRSLVGAAPPDSCW